MMMAVRIGADQSGRRDHRQNHLRHWQAAMLGTRLPVGCGVLACPLFWLVLLLDGLTRPGSAFGAMGRVNWAPGKAVGKDHQLPDIRSAHAGGGLGHSPRARTHTAVNLGASFIGRDSALSWLV
jgi:hypothetical protein